MPKARLGHVTLPSKDPEVLRDFYCEMFGMLAVGGSSNGATSFLASQPEEESHDLAWVRDPTIASGPTPGSAVYTNLPPGCQPAPGHERTGRCVNRVGQG
jgi:catechol 2,3-dioxygenase-like lactoylglutathione lyase family enzyme